MFKRFRPLRANANIRNLVQENHILLDDLVYPLFIIEGKGVKNPIASMPDIFQISIDEALKEIEELRALGLRNILIFGLPDSKNESGDSALSENAIVARAVHAIKEKFSDLYIIVDLCFCEYTSHGHCGILNANNEVDNDKTLAISAKQALILAGSGADMIAPSGMMDGIVCTLRKTLDENSFSHIPIMSYSTKFASAYYGPFRDIANSAPSFGDRKTYQMNVANRNEAILESLEDEKQGADILMIKPALAFLDIVRDLRERTMLPIALYNVSGEYAMLKLAGANGLIDYQKILWENMLSFKRAGANIIITYHAKEIARMIQSRF